MMPRYRRFLCAVVLLIGAFISTGTAAAQENGQAVYEANCAGCHQADGSGIPGSFPPLAGNPDAADGTYVESVIREGLSGPIEGPDGTYDGVMPSLSRLSDADIEAVVAYVATFASGATDTTATTIVQSTVADPGKGERLFRGSATFANGGPACGACHAAGDNSQMGGSGLGPDLTGVVARFGGRPGITAAILNPAFPTMQPLFADKLLTDDEAADLVAYLETLDGRQSDQGIDGLLIVGLGGLVLLMVFTVIVFRRPRFPYVQKLRSRS